MRKVVDQETKGNIRVTVFDDDTAKVDALISGKIVNIDMDRPQTNSNEEVFYIATVETTDGQTGSAIIWENQLLSGKSNGTWAPGAPVKVAIQLKGEYAGNATLELPGVEEEKTWKEEKRILEEKRLQLKIEKHLNHRTATTTIRKKSMKIKSEFPNYEEGLMFYIRDKNPVLASNDSKVHSYFIPLRNFKKGFDYYELTRHKSGSVYFSVTTMLGLRTVIKTTSKLITNDLTYSEWNRLIGDVSNKHLMREEYQALKKGYVKKGGGCFSGMILLVLIASFAFFV